MRLSLLLISLACALCLSVPAGVAVRAHSQVKVSAASSVLPTPSPQPEDERQPNVLKRFFSWTSDQLRRPFRRQPQIVCGLGTIVTSVNTSKSLVTLCPRQAVTSAKADCSPDCEVQVTANAAQPDGIELRYTWSVTGGSVHGEGRAVTWDLSGLAEGTYTATVEVNDGNTHTANGSTSVTVALCSGCERPAPPCPTVSLRNTNRTANQPIIFEASVSGGNPKVKPTYEWSITAGKIISGQGTSTLLVDISALGSQSITATVSLNGADPACTGSQASVIVPQ